METVSEKQTHNRHRQLRNHKWTETNFIVGVRYIITQYKLNHRCIADDNVTTVCVYHPIFFNTTQTQRSYSSYKHVQHTTKLICEHHANCKMQSFAAIESVNLNVRLNISHSSHSFRVKNSSTFQVPFPNLFW